jgi:type II secretion system protein G
MRKKLGFTLVELMVVLTVIALLLSVVVPDYVGRVKRAEEAVLKENLTLMRDALDKHYADAGTYPKISSPGTTCARSPRIRSRRATRPGFRSLQRIRKRAACTTSRAPQKATSAGKRQRKGTGHDFSEQCRGHTGSRR